jgi:hypothetical protein
MKQITIRGWTRIALFNLFIVACLGLLMRLKILLPLPWLDQRFTLHAHSHFAFSGWISHVLMLSVAVQVSERTFSGMLPVRHNRLLAFNLFCSYGMLVSFLIQGYAAISITFSTLSILVCFIFYRLCQTDISVNGQKQVWYKFIHAALIFNMISCLGTFLLAWTMATQPGNTVLRLASVYFYLHFQYNGWFFFGIMGLFHQWLYLQKISLPNALIQFRLFAISCVPIYLLSINWMAFPAALHVLTILTALIQFVVFSSFARALWKRKDKIAAGLSPVMRCVLSAVAIASVIKFGLQTASSLPTVAHFAFSLRPVVIAYLHLVLLGIISLFLICWLYMNKALKTTRVTAFGIIIFVSGIVFNEFFLMLQGIGSLSDTYISGMSQALAIAALILVTGIVIILQENIIPVARALIARLSR